MHRFLVVVAVVVALGAAAAFGQAPPPPPFSMQLQWFEPKSPAATYTVWGRSVTLDEIVPSNGHTSPHQTTKFELSEAQMNALIGLVPAFKPGTVVKLPPVERATSSVSASIVVNGSVLAVNGPLPQAAPAPELEAIAALKAILDAARPKPVRLEPTPDRAPLPTMG